MSGVPVENQNRTPKRAFPVSQKIRPVGQGHRRDLSPRTHATLYGVRARRVAQRQVGCHHVRTCVRLRPIFLRSILRSAIGSAEDGRRHRWQRELRIHDRYRLLQELLSDQLIGVLRGLLLRQTLPEVPQLLRLLVHLRLRTLFTVFLGLQLLPVPFPVVFKKLQRLPILALPS